MCIGFQSLNSIEKWLQRSSRELAKDPVCGFKGDCNVSSITMLVKFGGWCGMKWLVLLLLKPSGLHLKAVGCMTLFWGCWRKPMGTRLSDRL